MARDIVFINCSLVNVTRENNTDGYVEFETEKIVNTVASRAHRRASYRRVRRPGAGRVLYGYGYEDSQGHRGAPTRYNARSTLLSSILGRYRR